MARLDDLEAQLREGLDRAIDRDIIVVYADQLLELGDPRGELITIDLEIEQSGGTPLLTRRRGELVESWLGPQRPNGTIRFGFIDLDATSADPVEQIRVAFSGTAARFVRSITSVGPPKMLAEVVDAIAQAPRPFLSRVTLRQWSEKPQPTITDASAFVRATPNLRCLEIDARLLFADLEHPSLQRLRLSGFDAIRSLPRGELVLPSLTELDLAFHCHLATSRSEPSRDLIERLGLGLPQLTALDLSRNEPGFLDPHTLGGATPLFELLPELGCRDRLRSLTLPPVPADQLVALRATLASMPELVDLAIARTPVADHPALKRNLERPGLTLRLST